MDVECLYQVLVVSAGAFYFKRRQLNSKITGLLKH